MNHEPNSRSDALHELVNSLKDLRTQLFALSSDVITLKPDDEEQMFRAILTKRICRMTTDIPGLLSSTKALAINLREPLRSTLLSFLFGIEGAVSSAADSFDIAQSFSLSYHGDRGKLSWIQKRFVSVYKDADKPLMDFVRSVQTQQFLASRHLPGGAETDDSEDARRHAAITEAAASRAEDSDTIQSVSSLFFEYADLWDENCLHGNGKLLPTLHTMFMDFCRAIAAGAFRDEMYSALLARAKVAANMFQVLDSVAGLNGREYDNPAQLTGDNIRDLAKMLRQQADHVGSAAQRIAPPFVTPIVNPARATEPTNVDAIDNLSVPEWSKRASSKADFAVRLQMDKRTLEKTYDLKRIGGPKSRKWLIRVDGMTPHQRSQIEKL